MSSWENEDEREIFCQKWSNEEWMLEKVVYRVNNSIQTRNVSESGESLVRVFREGVRADERKQ